MNTMMAAMTLGLTRSTRAAAFCLLVACLMQGPDAGAQHPREYTSDFAIQHCDFEASGGNMYMSIEPGDRFRLAGTDSDTGGHMIVEQTVLNDTQQISFRIDGERIRVRTRVVEEREWIDGQLVEVSRNYYARCRKTNNIYFFGEDVEIYEDGELVSTKGSWRAGRDGALPGLTMPSVFLAGARYQQESAPESQDRANHRQSGVRVRTPAGDFDDCIKIVETTPLEPEERTVKVYAPNVGLVMDDTLRRVPIE